MSSTIKWKRKIGGAKSPPATGSEGELAIWKADTTPTAAVTLYVHDGVQWVELFSKT